MATEARGDEEEQEQWTYSIYLVSFPTVVERSENGTSTVSLVDMISRLVPEARIIQHHIFHNDPVSIRQHPFSRDEDEPKKEQVGSLPENQAVSSFPQEASEELDKQPRTGDLGSKARDVENTRSTAIKGVEIAAADDGDSVRDVGPATHATINHFSPSWIEKEALAILRTIQQNSKGTKSADQSKVLLAGFGFGGIVIKKAVIIANTTPGYYDVALDIHSLLFFATPHHPNNRLSWEDVLLDLIKATKRDYHGRLSHILLDLVDSVSQLSHVFCKFAAKYPIVNFIEGRGLGIDEPVVGEMGTFNNSFEETVRWLEKDFNSLVYCGVDDLSKLESLRAHFAPASLANQEISNQLTGTSEKVFKEHYFEALQTLSPSRYILYETRTLEKPDEFADLEEIYRPVLENIAWEDLCRKDSIQITGPAGHGKSALVRLVSQEIRRRSSVVAVENFFVPSGRPPPTLYSVYVSFLHQIISQRPTLFRPVRSLMVEILRQEAWTEANLQIILEAILHHSKALAFLIVIHDFEDWPLEIQSWWSKALGSLVKSCSSVITFLTSSHRSIDDLASSRCYEFDLNKSYWKYRTKFIHARTTELLHHTYSSVILEQQLSDNLRKKIESAAKSFQGSFMAINTFLVLLFQSFTLNTLETIESNIEASPQNEERLWNLETVTLRAKPPRIFFWASMVVSWTMWSVRPLRLEELSAAAAINLAHATMAEMRPMVSLDMKRDLRNHLGCLVAMENRYARIASASARKLLSTQDMRKLLDLQNDSSFTKLCLHYIKSILEDEKSETWEKCLFQVSWKHPKTAPQDPALEFLDYACRFWPTHFLLVEEPDLSLKDTIVEFLLTPNVGVRWFELYLLCSSQSASLLSGDKEVLEPLAVPQPKPAMPEKGSSSVESEVRIDVLGPATDARESAVRMASYVGLASIIPLLSNGRAPADKPKIVNVRRGYLERTFAFQGTDSIQYLEHAIANDDDIVVKEILESDRLPVMKYFPLHTAVLAGSIKVARTLFNLLESPAQADLGGKTPLHVAATGGGTEMVLFLLGKDGSDTQLRRRDVPNMIDIQDNNSQTPLITACRMGNIAAAKTLITSGADLAVQDYAGKSALHYAVLDCLEIVEDFVAQGSLGILDNDGSSPLHVAVYSGSVETLSMLVSNLRISRHLPIGDIDGQDKQGRTPLHHAAENGHPEVVRVLLDNRASQEPKDSGGKLAAELAAVHGHLATVKVFLSATEERIGDQLLEGAAEAGQLLVVQYLLHNKLASPDGDQTSDSRPLSLAASKGHNEVVRALLRYGADINIEDTTGQTPLHYAAENVSDRVAQTLLAHRGASRQVADVKALDIERNTPLHSAAKAGRVSTIQLLLKHKAEIEAASRTQQTALHVAVASSEAVQTLLYAGADPNTADLFGQTPLHVAVRSQFYESAECLLGLGTNIDARDDEGRTPLQYAIIQNDLKMVKLFCGDRPIVPAVQDRMHRALEWAVQNNASEVLRFLTILCPESINKPDKKGLTVIHKAAQMKSVEILALLIQSGGEVNLSSHQGSTPLHFSAIAGLTQNIRKLIESGAEVDKADAYGSTALHKVSRSDDNVEAVEVLLEAKATIDMRNSYKQTPLDFAAHNGRVEIVKKLLDGHADARAVDRNRWSPLHSAYGDLEITKILFEHGADINAQTSFLWTPLHLATSWSSKDVVNFLIEKGANLDQGDEDGDTALHIAVEEDAREILTSLLNNGADLNKSNNRGLTPLHVALMSRRALSVQLLLENRADFEVKTQDGQSSLSLAAGSNMQETLEAIIDLKSPSTSKVVWDFEDMVSAYWAAIEGAAPSTLKVLVKKEGRLLHEVSNEGYTGLETCLRKRRNRVEEDLVALQFLELGVDPFERPQTNQESYFELGIITRQMLKQKFMNACLEQAVKNLRAAASSPGFRELRIMIELGRRDLLERFVSPKDTVLVVSDEDGWSLNHFVYQFTGSVFANSGSTEPLKMTRTPTRLLVPPTWVLPNANDVARFELAPDRLEISFASSDKQSERSVVSLRADFPFPPRDLGLSYFEITIANVAVPPAPDQIPSWVTIGLCGELCDQTEAHPGWCLWSLGYHGDDGGFFEETSLIQASTEHTFGPGNTVGCGVDYANKEYFLTLDGKVIGRRHSKIIYRKLYPTIGHENDACNVKVNFGASDFMWRDAKTGNYGEPPSLQRKGTFRDRSQSPEKRSL